MQTYLNLLRHILDNGQLRTDRTGTGTLSVFGHQARYDLTKGFPAVTTKSLFFKGVVHELLWFLKCDTNVKYLQDNGVRIWDEWADEDGNLGPVYGAQWRKWETPVKPVQPKYEPVFFADGTMADMQLAKPGMRFFTDSSSTSSWVEPTTRTIDQIAQVIQQIKTNPDSRRLIVSAWNVGEVDKMKLPPCHLLFQFYVHDNKLSCQLYQRSADVFLGVPFNIASYALLTHMIAQVCGLGVGEFIHTIGDAHLYTNHVEQAKRQLSRTPEEPPTLWLNPEVKNIDDFKFEDIKLLNYKHQGKIEAPIAV